MLTNNPQSSVGVELPYVSSFEPPTPLVVGDEVFCRFLRHFEIALSHPGTPEIDFSSWRVVFRRITAFFPFYQFHHSAKHKLECQQMYQILDYSSSSALRNLWDFLYYSIDSGVLNQHC